MVTKMQNSEQRAEIFLCLSRAFLPPIADSAWVGMTKYLVTDLRDIATDLGSERGAEIDALESSLRGVPDHQSLLLGYSDLFFTPPVKVHLNAGVYLDGTLMGSHTMGIQEIYARNGVARSDDFKDMPDHLAIQLEFIALLFARLAEAGEDDADVPSKAARDFMRHFMAPWLPRFVRETAAKAEGRAGAAPYVHLASIVHAEVESALRELFEGYPLTEEEMGVEAVEEEVVASREMPAAGAGLEIMKQRLKEAGLDTSHLEIDQEKRDFNLGMQPKKPVTLNKQKTDR